MLKNRDVCVLVYPDSRHLKNKSFNYRAWAGLSIIKDVLERAGVQVGACDAEGASGKIVLASVPSAPSWYSLVKEWVKAKPKNSTLIIGGSGVLNVRPFLPLQGSVFVLGRGEDLISDVVAAAQVGGIVESESVIYSSLFDIDSIYRLHQGSQVYPHRVILENGRVWHEGAIGCSFRCYFCNYAWGRTAHQVDSSYGQQISERDAVVAGASNLEEHNLSDLVRGWRSGRQLGAGRMLNSAIDGQSQRIRHAIKKPVTRQMVRDAAKLAPGNTRFSLMTVVGFPTEAEGDRMEAIDDLKSGLLERSNNERWAVEVSPNSFRPMPVTPSALWPTQVRNWHAYLKKEWGAGQGGHQYRLFSTPDGNAGIKMMWSVGGEAHQLLDLIALRCTEDDFDNLVKLSLSGKFWAASAGKKAATLHKYFDTNKLAGEFTPENYPARYLEGNTPNREVWALGAAALSDLRRQKPCGVVPQDQNHA